MKKMTEVVSVELCNHEVELMTTHVLSLPDLSRL